jgi:hypothetical protein
MATSRPKKNTEPNPTAAAHWLWSEHLPSRQAASRWTAMVRHPLSPFCVPIRHEDDASLMRAAQEYIEKVAAAALDLDPELVERLRPGQQIRGFFGWLPVGWSSTNRRDPRLSFWVESTSANRPGLAADRTLVMLGGVRKKGEGAIFSLGSRWGLRVTAHLRQASGGAILCFTGATYVPPPAGLGVHAAEKAFPRNLGKALPSIRRAIESLLALRGRIDAAFQGVTRLSSDQWALIGGALDPRTGDSYDLLIRLRVANGAPSVVSTELHPRRTHHAAKVFGLDPASRGTARTVSRRAPRRRADLLDAMRSHPITLPPSPATPLCNRWINSLHTEGNGRPAKAVTVVETNTNPALRSNALAALHAFERAQGLFACMAGYGLDPELYFKFARLPLLLRHRGPMQPAARDGVTVNAQAAFTLPAPQFNQPYASDRWPQIELTFGMADVFARLRRAGGSRHAEYLGLAADPRWAWHEFGHALIGAATGELELAFAHSVGDALAAIVCDPTSKLATDPEARGRTFPWVEIARRHDRSPEQGWSWTGLFHRIDRLGQDNPLRSPRKGYTSEQVLSSSLFRLYRCLGGDSRHASGAVDEGERVRAAHYTVYLIMRACALIGPAAVASARSADQFVSALIDADLGTGRWAPNDPRGDFVSGFRPRIGGCAVKVIRWAFEAQGLFSGVPIQSIWNAPGKPPAVDIFLRDRRTRSGDAHRAGGYLPVSLDGHFPERGQPPAWSAARDAIRMARDGLHVRVVNRGQHAAQRVSVSVWCKALARQTNLTKLAFSAIGQGGWTRVPGPKTPKNVPASTSRGVVFKAFRLPKRTGRYVVLAISSCADDPAITAETTHAPSSRLRTPLVDLVAGDNNIGLTMFRVRGQRPASPSPLGPRFRKNRLQRGTGDRQGIGKQ